MKKRLQLVAIIVGLFTQVNAQDLTLDWAYSLGGNNLGTEEGKSVTTDSFGNIYTTGFFEGTIDLDPGAGILNVTSNGSWDFYIQKLDPAGNLVWGKSIGGVVADRSYTITLDDSENLYISGSFAETVDFDPGVGTFFLSVPMTSGYSVPFILKLNNLGNFIWAKAMEALASDGGSPTSLEIGVNGEIYTSGSFRGVLDLDPSGNTFNVTSNGSSDIYISKLDSLGDFVWGRSMGGLQSATATAYLSLGQSDSICLSGSFRDTVDFDPGIGIFNLVSNGSLDVFVAKLDSSSNFIWAKSIGSTGNDQSTSISVNSIGEILIAGIFSGIVDFDPSVGVENITSNGSLDAFVQKFTCTGNSIWVKNMGGSGATIGRNIEVASDGNIFVSGRFSNTTDFDPSTNVNNLTSTGNFDIYVQKLDSDGGFVWAESMQGAGNGSNHCTDLEISSTGNIYITGKYKDTVDFDPSINNYNVISTGGTYDAYLAKFVGPLCTPTTNTITSTICTTYTVPSGDETYTTSGTYMDTIPNVGGCDSVLTINLTINNSTTGTDIISACGSHSWIDGNFYTSSNNTATHTLTNSVGCDSVVTLNLTILSLSGNTINVSACDSYTVPSGDETYTASGNYLDTLVNSIGCDSALLINLTIIYSTSGSENITACDSYTWSANTTTYTTSGSYTATLVNSVGCDSIATLNLTINNSNSGSENITACDSYMWSANTTTYNTSGSYTAALVNSVGCDSTATLNLTITNSTSGSENVTACDGYTWSANTTTYNTSGSYTATLTNVNGCDSTATLNLTIETIDNTVSQTGIVLTANASGYSYQWVDCDNGNAEVTGETNQSFTPTVNGNYAVEISSATCTETSACTVINSVGIESLEELGVKIYPNPSTGEFTIDVQTNCEVEIVNAIGEIVFNQKLVSGANAINISTNPNGLYFINVKTKDAAYSKRIVLSK